MAGLSLTGINKIYPNGYHAVKDVELEIRDKEFMILVGPSGCGKTTTLRMIAGLEEISKGEMKIGERVVNEVSPKDRDIAMVFQNYALYPHMTVYDNMSFGLKLRKQSKEEIDQRVTKAADILGIEPLLDRKPKQLSGGQRQRVALGRAIVRNPQVFLMDEPLSNLDAKLRVQMRAELIKLHEELSTTFIYVTHDQTEAMTMGTRICVMNNGLIQQVDDPHTIYTKPANKFVAGFIGAPQMNFLDARIMKMDDGVYATFDGGRALLSEEALKQFESEKYINKDVTLGIRPEDIQVHHDESKADIKAKIDVTELLGAETILYLEMNGNKIIAKTKPNQSIKSKDPVSLTFDTTRIHLFDKETELALV